MMPLDRIQTIRLADSLAKLEIGPYLQFWEVACPCDRCLKSRGFLTGPLLTFWRNMRLGERVPIGVGRGFSCPHKNGQLMRSHGASRTSKHMYGEALDFSIRDADHMDANLLRRLIEYGAHRIGRAGNFIHVDIHHSAPCFWKYLPGRKRQRDDEAHEIHAEVMAEN